MQMYLEAQRDKILDVVNNGPFILTIFINNVEQPKVEGSLNDDDKKKVLFDKKEKIYLHLPWE